ncbi:hypothetical protein KIL84_004115 [Mauremys mutica]|uniref:H15 domain-containing protein n=1 Tax=Mauremys mutica TaxID=74926 RepID=A0A9D4B5Z8_9SAUR|nr:hypothetical protein KIL84_004115 [Mauremys mutica]
MNTDQPAAPSQAPASKRTKRKKKKAVLITRKVREGFAHFILQTVDFSQHSGEVSLGVIRKELAAVGIDVKNKARIKAGLRKLVDTNVLLKVPGSYKLIAEAKLPPQLVKKDKSPKKQGAEKIKRGGGKAAKKKATKKAEDLVEQEEGTGETVTSHVHALTPTSGNETPSRSGQEVFCGMKGGLVCSLKLRFSVLDRNTLEESLELRKQEVDSVASGSRL